jgi:tetratricopeptide (TPR) repeat protein
MKLRLRQLSCAASAALLLTAGLAVQASAEDLDSDLSWDNIRSQNRSVVIGRFAGQFSSPDYRHIRIRVVDLDTDEDIRLDVAEGLGFIEELLPPGRYALVGVEATYFPAAGGPVDITKYRPVQQRYMVNPRSGQARPIFDVPDDRPAYIGTIYADSKADGLVYKGHHWRIMDEFDLAFARVEQAYPRLTESLAAQNIVPLRSFALKPSKPDSLLEFVGVEDPINKAREYIAEGKYDAAINWLATFLPANDAERLEVELLIGEALLGEGDYDEAIERLGDVLLAEPETVRALRLLARAHGLKGNLDDARALYEALAEIDPKDTEANLHLGYLYAIESDAQRSAIAFSTAFRDDSDYLLHDLVPFLVALRGAELSAGRIQPPVPKGSVAPPPPSIRSRRTSDENGGMAVLINHEGKVVAAQLTASSGPIPYMVMSMVRASFEPAAVNGIPVPWVLSVGGESDQ